MVDIDVHPVAVAELMSPRGDVGRATARMAGRVRDRAKQYAPVNTGLLRNSITSELIDSSQNNLTYRIGSDVPYAKYQESGTNGPIYPRYARALAFKIGGRTVFAKHVRGVPAVHFLERALNEVVTTENLRG